MSGKSAKIVVILVVAVIAFCFAGVCASLTGEISLGLNESNNTFVNLTNDSSQDDVPVDDTGYSESSYDTSSSSDSSQNDYYEESAGNGHQHQGGEDTGGEPSQPQEPPTGDEGTPSEG